MQSLAVLAVCLLLGAASAVDIAGNVAPLSWSITLDELEPIATTQRSIGVKAPGRSILQAGAYPPPPTPKSVTVTFLLDATFTVTGGVLNTATGIYSVTLPSATATGRRVTGVSLEAIAAAVRAAYPTSISVTVYWNPKTRILEVTIIFPASATTTPTSLDVQAVVYKAFAPKKPTKSITSYVTIYQPAVYTIITTPIAKYTPPMIVVQGTKKPPTTVSYVSIKPSTTIKSTTRVGGVYPILTTQPFIYVTVAITLPARQGFRAFRPFTINARVCDFVRRLPCTPNPVKFADPTFIACRFLLTAPYIGSKGSISVTATNKQYTAVSYTIAYPSNQLIRGLTGAVTGLNPVVTKAYLCVWRKTPAKFAIPSIYVPIKYYEEFTNVARYYSGIRW